MKDLLFAGVALMRRIERVEGGEIPDFVLVVVIDIPGAGAAVVMT